MSIARWNLKEAAGKALARRTEIAYEAVMLDEEANIFKVRYLYREHRRICGGHKREGGCALPGEVSMFVSHNVEYMTTVTETLPDGHGEVSRRHSRSIDRTEGLNMNHGV